MKWAIDIKVIKRRSLERKCCPWVLPLVKSEGAEELPQDRQELT